MVILLKIIQVILALSLLVLFHEFGHYTFAKLFKTRVEKFYLFFNPKLSLAKFKRFDGKWHCKFFSPNEDPEWDAHPEHTEYGIGWLPFGGYCKIAGMIDESMDTEAMKLPPQPYEFRTKKVWQRFFIMFGGVLFNFILAIVLYAAILGTWGEEYLRNDDAVYGVAVNELSREIGFRDGDRILAFDGKPIDNFASLQVDLVRSQAREATVLRDGDTLTLAIDPDYLPAMLNTPGMFDLAFPFVVKEVPADSPNADAGLAAGDAVTGIDGEPMFGFMRGAYTAAEIREIDKSAATTRYGAPPRASVTNGLPAGCVLLEYVESTGAQYVKSGINSVPTTLSFVYVFENLAADGTWRGLVGARNGSTAYGSQSYNVFARKGSVRLDVTGRSVTVSTSGTNTLSYTPGTTTFNGVEYANNSKSDLNAYFLLFSFGRNQNSDGGFANPSPQRLFSCSISTNGVSVRDYIPVKDANGVAGLWDRISGQVFYSATATPLVAGPERLDGAMPIRRKDADAWLAPPPGSGEVTDGDLWLDCLAIPEGNWLCECPIAGGTNTAWRAALCPSNILAAVVWRHAVGLAPTNLPVTIAHDPTRAIGRIEHLYYEQGTGVIARLRVRSAGYAEALSNRCDNLSPDLRCFTTGTNVAVRTDGWRYEHQDYLDERVVPMLQSVDTNGNASAAAELASFSAVTNVPAGVQAVVMAPIFLKGISFVQVDMQGDVSQAPR